MEESLFSAPPADPMLVPVDVSPFLAASSIFLLLDERKVVELGRVQLVKIRLCSQITTTEYGVYSCDAQVDALHRCHIDSLEIGTQAKWATAATLDATWTRCNGPTCSILI